ncbi:MAG: endonuclease/exonuclease/phosphatase family protein [Desulfomonilaceae bacterium]|nr:endonuclease/exonuclease/phosphatase family protein [Desulfomonilaceae bacterium]
MPLLSAATYNIHRWVGTDGQCVPERIIDVIREIDADIIGLQEVSLTGGGADVQEAGQLFKIPGMNVILGPTLPQETSYYGNVLLTRRPVTRVARIDLSVDSREPRGAIDADMDMGGVNVRVIVTHLGLKGYERRSQIDNLLALVAARKECVTILMGDFNVWFPRSRLFPAIEHMVGRAPALRTYPSRFPLFRLDRIWVRPEESLREIHVHRTPEAKIASDHLPVKAVIEMPGECLHDPQPAKP